MCSLAMEGYNTTTVLQYRVLLPLHVLMRCYLPHGEKTESVKEWEHEPELCVFRNIVHLITLYGGSLNAFEQFDMFTFMINRLIKITELRIDNKEILIE